MKSFSMRFFFLVLFSYSTTYAMVADNRYFPWYGQQFSRNFDAQSHVSSELFFIVGDKAFGRPEKIGQTGNIDEKKGIPEVWGVYDQKVQSDVLIALGIASPLYAQWQAKRAIEWDVDQKLEGQGYLFRGEWELPHHWYVGCSGGFMKVHSMLSFEIPRTTRNDLVLTAQQEIELDNQRRTMNQLIGLTIPQWSATGLLDTQVYVRYGNTWEYVLKCRQVDAGVWSGFYIPSGVKRSINNPASVPFGGNGAGAFFCGADIALELKEDVTLGCAAHLSQRFTKTYARRLPLKKENHLFGGTTGLVKVYPGVTTVFNSYIMLGDLRDGVGARIGYSLAIHAGDVWADRRVSPSIAVDLNKINARSRWKGECFSINVHYDVNKVIKYTQVHPVISFNWDVPVHFFAAKNVSKTHKVSLGIEFPF